MMPLKSLQKRIRGWLPKEPVFMQKPMQQRWRRPAWVAVTLIAVVALAFAAYTGAQTIIRYSNPQADVTANYFEKTVNCTSAQVGDVVEVKVLVGWHGYVLPEFKRHVEIIDLFPEDNFKLVEGNNTHKYLGCGGGDQWAYFLEVINKNVTAVDLPCPQLYLDNIHIPVRQVQGVLQQ